MAVAEKNEKLPYFPSSQYVDKRLKTRYGNVSFCDTAKERKRVIPLAKFTFILVSARLIKKLLLRKPFSET